MEITADYDQLQMGTGPSSGSSQSICYMSKQEGCLRRGYGCLLENSVQMDCMNAESFHQIGIVFRQCLRYGILQRKWLEDSPVLK